MIGAMYGDIKGSVYEFRNYKYYGKCDKETFFTDDTVMTVAVAKTILELKREKLSDEDFKQRLVENMQKLGRKYPWAGYGGRFQKWLCMDVPKPYNSFGNGSAMRVSPVGFAFEYEDEVVKYARLTAEVTHNHPEGIKGAVATALAIFWARKYDGVLERELPVMYDLDFTIEDITPSYKFDETCQGTMPVAFKCVLEGKDFDDVMDKVIEVGGDTDTIGAIAMAIAEARWGVSNYEIKYVKDRIPKEFWNLTVDFYNEFRNNYER